MNADSNPSNLQVRTTPALADVSVLLVAEGTYPYHFGGVSTWCDGLISCLPEVPFHLLSISDHPRVSPMFALAPNVLSHTNRPVWGLRFCADGNFGACSRFRKAGPSFKTSFLPAYSQFLDQIFGPSFDTELCSDALHTMHLYFIDHGFDVAMRSDDVWQLSNERLAELLANLGPMFGTARLQPSMADVALVTMWLRHWLSVLAAPIPETTVVQTVMAGLCTLIAVCAKREHGAVFVATEHGVYLREVYLAEGKTKASLLKLVRIQWARRMTALTYEAADQISPCCDFNQRWELRTGAQAAKLRTIYYGMNPGLYEPRAKSAVDGAVVTWVGRINPLKDVETLLRAAAIVCAERPDVTFNLFGAATEEDQPYESRCQALWHELGLGERAIFRGFTSRPHEAFRDADVVVLPSISEGFPNSTLEAMLAGRAVVVSSVGGLPEQVAGTGIAVEPRNPKELAEAISALLEDDVMRRRLGDAAHERATTRFTVERLRAEHLQSYRRLLDGHGPSAALGTIPGEGSVRVVSSEGPRSPVGGRVRGSRTILMVGPETAKRKLRKNALVLDSPSLRSLASEIARELPEPVDPFEVTALLEASGLNDERASERYGIPDVFATGQWVFDEISRRNLGREWWTPKPLHMVAPMGPLQSSRPVPSSSSGAWTGARTLGASVLVLALLQLARVSGGWTAGQTFLAYASVAFGMAIAGGTALTFARPASFYLASEDGRLLRGALRQTTTTWAIINAFCVALLTGGAALRGQLRSAPVGIIVAAFLVSSALWTLLAVASQLRGGRISLVPFGSGVVAAIAVDRSLVLVTRIHLGIAVIVGCAVSTFLFRSDIRRLVEARLPFDPRSGIGTSRFVGWSTAQDAYPYFLSGAVGSTLLIAPHLLVWFPGNRNATWSARSQFELGVTVGLLPLLCCVGLTGKLLQRFWRQMPGLLETTSAHRPKHLGLRVGDLVTELRNKYVASIVGASIFALVSYCLFLGTGAIRPLARGDLWWLMLCFVGGLVAGTLFGLAQFYVMIALSLGRPQLVVRAGISSLLFVLVVGIPLAGVWSWRTALISLVLSSALYAFLTRRACRDAVSRSAQLTSTIS